MKNLIRMVAGFAFAILALVFISESAVAQDAAKVDPEHYKVEFENDQVRILRITYGPHEKSVMHWHPEGVAVFLTGGKGQFTFPDGKKQEITWTPGQAIWLDAGKHLPENLTDKPFELIQVELKGKRAETEHEQK